MSKGTTALKTERLLLRRHIMEDAEVLYRDFGLDEEMFKYSGWNPYATPDAARETVSRFIAQYAEDRFYGWGIEYEGRLVGTIGAYDYDPETDSIEIGCSIERGRWGKGFGTESVKAVIHYLTEQEGIQCVTAWCAKDNVGSGKIMEKAGMRLTDIEEDALEIGGRKYDKMNYCYQAGCI